MSRLTVAWVTSKPRFDRCVGELALAADRAGRDELADRRVAVALGRVAAGRVTPRRRGPRAD